MIPAMAIAKIASIKVNASCRDNMLNSRGRSFIGVPSDLPTNTSSKAASTRQGGLSHGFHDPDAEDPLPLAF
jgi:hypothetical protein